MEVHPSIHSSNHAFISFIHPHFTDDDDAMDGYCARANQAIRARDGATLATCVDVRVILNDAQRDLMTMRSDAQTTSVVDSACASMTRECERRGIARDEGWSEILGAFACAAAMRGCAAAAVAGGVGGGASSYKASRDAHANATKALVKAFKSAEDGEWMTPVIRKVVDDTREVAQLADEELKRRGEKPSCLADAGSTLMLVYRAVSQTSNAEKKTPQLHVVNALFKVYFELNALHLCKNLINAVNLPTFLPFDSFPKSEKVTYNFYVGRLAVFEDAYERAEKHLAYAFAKCHKSSKKNIRLILRYLIPVKLILGILPSKKLLETYGLNEFRDVVEAMRRGDARLLDSALDAGEAEFIRQGTYLILEKLRMSVYRTLFKRVHAIHGAAEPAKSNQVALRKFQIALELCGADVDADEVECIVANLIFRKFVKGYISHKNKVVVLSKTDAFPSLKSVFADA